MEIFSPFLSVPEEDRLCENSWCFAIFDSFPVSVGHVLVVTKRVVETWFDCTAEEQGALMDLVNVAKGQPVGIANEVELFKGQCAIGMSHLSENSGYSQIDEGRRDHGVVSHAHCPRYCNTARLCNSMVRIFQAICRRPTHFQRWR